MKDTCRTLILIALILTFAALPACGNKGPLVMPPPKADAG
ncbi:MAG: lipoprotein [Xanthomonadaceae bacterium]|jgi:predicted small lipoprotein YifL|nr:lipoprotein [Xanthomonadaceae bacterium]